MTADIVAFQTLYLQFYLDKPKKIQMVALCIKSVIVTGEFE